MTPGVAGFQPSLLFFYPRMTNSWINFYFSCRNSVVLSAIFHLPECSKKDRFRRCFADSRSFLWCSERGIRTPRETRLDGLKSPFFLICGEFVANFQTSKPKLMVSLYKHSPNLFVNVLVFTGAKIPHGPETAGAEWGFTNAHMDADNRRLCVPCVHVWPKYVVNRCQRLRR